MRIVFPSLIIVALSSWAGAAKPDEVRLRDQLAREIAAGGRMHNAPASATLSAIGDIQRADGRLEDARTTYDNALRMGEDTEVARTDAFRRTALRLARLYNLTGDDSRATMFARDVIDDPATPPGLRVAAQGIMGLGLARRHDLEAADRALSLAIEGPVDPGEAVDRADLLATRAEVRALRGLPEAAEADARAALALDRARYGAMNERVLASNDAVARMLADRFAYDEAQVLMTASVTARRKARNRSALASALNNLAVLHLARGKPEAAEGLLREVFEIRSSMLGESDPATRLALANLALCLAQMHRYDPAEGFLRRVLALDIGAPDERWTAATTEVQLASVLLAQRRLGEAATLLRDALVRQQQGWSSREWGLTMNNLAFVLVEQGKFAAAEPLAREALRAAMEQSDTELVLAKPRKNLGRALAGLGRIDEARVLLLAAERAQVESLGPAHPDTILSDWHLAELETKQADDAVAGLAWYRSASERLLARTRDSGRDSWQEAELREGSPVFRGFVAAAWQLSQRISAPFGSDGAR